MKDAFYFPHFCNARHDRKIRRVRKELGLEGYGIFFMLLEILREQADYKYPLEDIDLLADEFGTSEQKLKTVISNYELFQVDKDEKFFSANFIMYLQPYLENKERKRVSGIRGNLIRYKYITKDESNEMNDQDILLRHKKLGFGSQCDRLAIARKGKETKEIKESKYIDTNSIIDYFNEITGQKRRYSKTSQKPIQARLNDNFSIDDCKKVIDIKYIEWKDNKDMQKYITIETLFRPSNFEKYLNQEIVVEPEDTSGIFIDDYSPIAEINRKEYKELYGK